MRKVIVQEWISVEGFAAGPDDSVDFVPSSTRQDGTFAREQMAFLATVDTILLGRVTYQMFASYWPTVDDQQEKPFADLLNATPKVVFSRTLERAPWGAWPDARIVTSDPAAEVQRLKQLPGKDMIVWGSLSIAQALASARLVDEYRLVLCPLLLGSGRPLFRDGTLPADLTLANVTRLDHGAVSLQYQQPRGEGA